MTVEVADFTGGTGLMGLKDRVDALGGCIDLHSPRGGEPRCVASAHRRLGTLGHHVLNRIIGGPGPRILSAVISYRRSAFALPMSVRRSCLLMR